MKHAIRICWFLLVGIAQSQAQSSDGTVPIEVPVYPVQDGAFTMQVSLQSL